MMVQASLIMLSMWCWRGKILLPSILSRGCLRTVVYNSLCST